MEYEEMVVAEEQPSQPVSFEKENFCFLVYYFCSYLEKPFLF